MNNLMPQAFLLSRRSFLIGMAGAGVNFCFGPAEGVAEATPTGNRRVRADHLVQHRP